MVEIKAPPVDYDTYPSLSRLSDTLSAATRGEIESEVETAQNDSDRIISYVLTGDNYYSKIMAAQKLRNLGESIERQDLISFLKNIGESENNIWVHNAVYQSLEQISRIDKHKNTVQQYFMDNSLSKEPYFRLWSLCGLIKMNVFYDSLEISNYIKSRILKDHSNYVRVGVVDAIGRSYEENDTGRLLEFSAQFNAHTDRYDPSRYTKVIEGYFQGATLLIDSPSEDIPLGESQPGGSGTTKPISVPEHGFTERLKNHPLIVLLTVVASILTILSYYGE